ncbi:MAG: hypothetical protein WCD89_03615 [Anaerocolumna sp.]
MNKIRYAIIGNGYRAMAFLGVGLALPEQFEVTSVLFRNKEKALEFSKTHSTPAAVELSDRIIIVRDVVRNSPTPIYKQSRSVKNFSSQQSG